MNYFKIVKENLKDPKRKALTQLAIYFIFFIFVVIILRSADNAPVAPSVVDTKTPMEVYTDMESFNYKVTYTNINKIDIIEGTYYNNTSLFTYNNLKYYYEDFIYIIDNDSYYLSNIEYNISKIFNNNLNNIIEELEEESETTYKDGKVVTNYTIDSNKLYKYLFDLESIYDNLSRISITEDDDVITNIVIDLTSLNINLTKVEIDYSNINNIESLEFNKDNYTYKESL